MAELRLRNINDDVLKALDNIVEKEKYASRNQLVNEILTQYVTCKNDFFTRALPQIVQALCLESIKNQNEKVDLVLDSVAPIFAKILNDLDDLRSIFYDELPKE